MLDLPLILEEQETCLVYGATKRNSLVSAHYYENFDCFFVFFNPDCVLRMGYI